MFVAEKDQSNKQLNRLGQKTDDCLYAPLKKVKVNQKSKSNLGLCTFTLLPTDFGHPMPMGIHAFPSPKQMGHRHVTVFDTHSSGFRKTLIIYGLTHRSPHQMAR